jgi:glycosyltransferase involved in cell wall biosynthesis
MLNQLAGGILLVTSRYEGFSLSLVEGMSQGLIPVAYPVGIAPEIIRNGKNGFLITSQAEGKKIIQRLLNASQKQRQRMALEARETAKVFTTKAISKSLLKIYTQVLQRGPRPDRNKTL